MEPEHELNAVNSPRHQTSLNQELGQFEGHLEFELAENPFSYDEDEVNRDRTSSD